MSARAGKERRQWQDGLSVRGYTYIRRINFITKNSISLQDLVVPGALKSETVV
ncbi:MAG: hypothetical protein AB1671_11370 [Thermodesulfobacteriota bacterium]